MNVKVAVSSGVYNSPHKLMEVWNLVVEANRTYKRGLRYMYMYLGQYFALKITC